jgi:ATP-dependent helicase/nuclease subunit A
LLLEGIGVQDLLKIGEFLLLPEDDLTLATVLKGPLFNLSEEDLFKVAYDRGHKSLWQCLLTTPQFEDISVFLKDLLSRTDFLTPFELYSHILGPLGGRKKWQERLGAEVVDSLDEFLNLCLLFQEEKTPSLQGFMCWISQEVIELKRDLEQSNQVRVMTVHGSKGLQAPIVFLPDTTQPPFDTPPFGFYNKSLIWLPSSDKDIPLTKAVKQELREAQFEEYRRLLYVALTRAEDALYVCGWEGSAQETWYSLVTEGIKKVGEPFDGGWRLSSVQKGVALPLKKEEKPDFLLPQWLQIPPLPETTPKLLRPSEEEKDDRYSLSEWGKFGTERGILIHKLLEILPGVREGRREKTALRYLENKRISKDIALDMAHCAEKVLKAYPDLFGPGSQGEVAVMGYLGTSLLSGQIDRLIVNDDHILIVDFKTHGDVPKSLGDISNTYLKQMAIYQAALSQIYPERPILCGLLWTEEPRLDVLPEALLKKFMPLIDGESAEDYNRKNLSYS